MNIYDTNHNQSQTEEKWGDGAFTAAVHVKVLWAVLALILAYLPIFFWMWERWFSRDSYYSHGILVPFVTLFLIWQKKEKLAQLPYVASRWPWVLIISGFILYFFSSMFRVYFSAGISMILVLCGIVLIAYGQRVFQEIAFPIFFLIFMIPAPMVVITNLSFKMKLFAAQIATHILNSIRIPAIRDGSMIRMRHAVVVVDDVCSGLRSLISLTALGTIFAYWLKGNTAKKIVLFLSTIPIAIITNVFRIVFLSSVSEIWGSERAGGLVHDISGFSVFFLAFLLLYAVAKLLE